MADGALGVLTTVRAMFEHGAWADAQLLAVVRGQAADLPEVRRELAHIRGAQATWLARITGASARLPVWPELDADGLAREGEALDGAWRTLLDGLAAGPASALARVVAYTTTTGAAFETPLLDILHHVVLHGHYHRGKANAALRAGGAVGEGVDYVKWQRGVGRRETGDGSGTAGGVSGRGHG